MLSFALLLSLFFVHCPQNTSSRKIKSKLLKLDVPHDENEANKADAPISQVLTNCSSNSYKKTCIGNTVCDRDKCVCSPFWPLEGIFDKPVCKTTTNYSILVGSLDAVAMALILALLIYSGHLLHVARKQERVTKPEIVKDRGNVVRGSDSATHKQSNKLKVLKRSLTFCIVSFLMMEFALLFKVLVLFGMLEANLVDTYLAPSFFCLWSCFAVLAVINEIEWTSRIKRAFNFTKRADRTSACHILVIIGFLYCSVFLGALLSIHFVRMPIGLHNFLLQALRPMYWFVVVFVLFLYATCTGCFIDTLLKNVSHEKLKVVAAVLKKRNTYFIVVLTIAFLIALWDWIDSMLYYRGIRIYGPELGIASSVLGSSSLCAGFCLICVTIVSTRARITVYSS